ncbi:olfactory receptor 51M1-like [Saccostrea echinata]|uniref:olfactory receptor 51M1-like n=1 Tax=Saccostrea echinata TaxID=191078 RepID=UPI002A7FEFEA|nr:olfactory receptor 51M1-like [Saccostrea echinata]
MDRNSTVEDLFLSSRVNNRSLFMPWNNLTSTKGADNILQDSFVTFISASIIFVAGAFGNCFTVILIFVKKNLHTPTYTVIACLGIADLLASFSRFASILDGYYWTFNYMESSIYHIITMFFLHAADCHIVLFAYVRCSLISSPFESLRITCGKILRISAVLWVLSGIVTFAYGTENWKLFVCTWYSFPLSISISYLCLMLNYCINPIVYFLFSPPARKLLLSCRRFCS